MTKRNHVEQCLLLWRQIRTSLSLRISIMQIVSRRDQCLAFVVVVVAFVCFISCPAFIIPSACLEFYSKVVIASFKFDSVAVTELEFLLSE